VKTIEEIRLENLRTLCAAFPSQRKFAAQLGKPEQNVGRWLTAFRPVSNEAAREIEEKCGKPRGWLDNDHTRMGLPDESSKLSQIVGAIAAMPEARQDALLTVLNLNSEC